MSRLSPTHHVPLHVMYDRMDDKRLKMSRCSTTTHKAILNADRLASHELRRFDRKCARMLLVFVDDHKEPDRLAYVLFALDDGTSIVAHVGKDGAFSSMSRHNIDARKSFPRLCMYELAGVNIDYDHMCNDYYQDYEFLHTRVYARNRSCYKF